jgi:hypothetical protein
MPPLPGIHTYCFRWCVCRPFTDRCRTYAMGIELGAERPGSHQLPAAPPALSGNFSDFLARLYRLNLPSRTDHVADTSTPEALAALSRNPRPPGPPYRPLTCSPTWPTSA